MQGTLKKMANELGEVVQYKLRVGEESLPLNPLLGDRLELHFTGNIYCQACGRKTKKSFSQGYCYPCMNRLAACDMCILKPEQCHYHQGTCREPEWAESHCMVDHVVYLANTSGLKVGITRASQIPIRWMDQGATAALPVFEVKTRHISGLIEVELAKLMADKTNWRAMLKGDGEPIALVDKAHEVRPAIAERLEQLKIDHGEDALDAVESNVTEIRYPVLQYPEKISSFNFDKIPTAGGTLIGIKGQYLMFDQGVINIRKFTSYEVSVTH